MDDKFLSKKIRCLLIFCISMLIVGCAKKKHPNDPFESLNRGVYSLNKGLDNLYFKPIAKTYNYVIPPPIRGGVGNFVQNVNEIPTSINDVLQGKPGKAGSALFRLVVNSTFGIFGIFDIASDIGVERHTENLSNTLLIWGYKDSSYLVLPILGPSTVRDTAGLIGNIFITPTYYAKTRWRNAYLVVSFIHKRAELLPVSDVIESASAIDEYAFVRNAYLQRRASIINQDDSVATDSKGKNAGAAGAVVNNDILDEPPE